MPLTGWLAIGKTIGFSGDEVLVEGVYCTPLLKAILSKPSVSTASMLAPTFL
ncbi:hypothetical protein [Gilliamella sp. ESL0443]|uniref:hypothetical protein n=1 Tax=Gilliamella sp. ESL0443 TaxID=2704655 RepID=UPI001C6A85BE|nr:hypothetical protein [Gilliamella sp. ESL0443]QYN41846.1 hypothetical protein GYM76_03380 [Gilliamella sp. ESL0443]